MTDFLSRKSGLRCVPAREPPAGGDAGTGRISCRHPTSARGLRAINLLRAQRPEQLHSRKLRSFAEVAFQ